MAKRKHLIIGSGSAGLSAAQEIRRITAEDEIRIVSMEDYLPYSPTALPYLLAGKVDEAKIAMKGEDFFADIGATFLRGKEVLRLLPETKEVVYKDGGRESFDTLLIASGSEASRPPIKGLDGSTYMGFHTIEDCRQLLKILQGKKEVAVLGAGLVGMEVAIGLVERGCQVTIIEKEPRLLPLYFDQEAETLIRPCFLNKRVKILTGKEVSKVTKRGGKVAVTLSDSSVTADVLVSCVGVQARTAFLDETAISLKHGILTDRRMMTNVKDIYAAGDASEAQDLLCGEYGMNQIIESAVDEGRVAGANMAGEEAEYEGWISSNIFNFFGNIAFSAGLSMPNGDGYEVYSEEDARGSRFKKLVYAGDRLVGAMFLNIELDPGLILYLIRNRVDISAHKQRLFEQPKEISRGLMLDSEKKRSLPISIR